MKDNRFIELVNLYIDRQISGEEMAELEAEMQASPRRRAVYRQYCQMHRATTLVYESFRTEESGQPAVTMARQGAVARFEAPGRRRQTPWTYYAAGLAAACAALVFVRGNFAGTVSAPQVATSAKTAPAVVAALPTPVAPATQTVVAPEAKVAAPRANSLVAEQDYAAMLAAMRREEIRAFANGSIQPSRAPSLFEDGVFDAQSSSSTRAFRNKPAAPRTESAAFQFQR